RSRQPADDDGPLDEAGMATLQYALTRGLEIVFQLEAGETLTEPTPSRECRKAILAYEATEGGAGVLGRLAGEPDAFARIAQGALELMHYRALDAAIQAADPGLLDEVPDPDCVAGCYRCLLSYFNQPDHEAIDRRHQGALRVLLRLARSTIRPLEAPVDGVEQPAWREAIAAWGLPAPDASSLEIAGVTLPLAWRAHLVCACFDPVGPGVEDDLAAAGYTLVGLTAAPAGKAPAELIELLGQRA
ncbi:MAG: DUF1998 domain-containing protein, partial [Caulobacteraceae bacterium]